MCFKVYSNDPNNRTTIHEKGCSHIEKRGGIHSYDEGEWSIWFEKITEAIEWAKSRRKKELRFCQNCLHVIKLSQMLNQPTTIS